MPLAKRPDVFMATETIEVDLSERADRLILSSFVSSLRGKQRVSAQSMRGGRTYQQNRYYFGVVVKAFEEFLREQGQHFTKEECHNFLRYRFLRKSVCDLATGELLGETTPSTTSLQIDEFSEYIEKCIAYLGETFGIVIPTM